MPKGGIPYSGNIYAQKVREFGDYNADFFIRNWGNDNVLPLPTKLEGWSSGTSYVAGRVVSYLGKSYKALRTTIGDQPDINSLDWQDSTVTINGVNQIWQCSDPTTANFFPAKTLNAVGFYIRSLQTVNLQGYFNSQTLSVGFFFGFGRKSRVQGCGVAKTVGGGVLLSKGFSGYQETTVCDIVCDARSVISSDNTFGNIIRILFNNSASSSASVHKFNYSKNCVFKNSSGYYGQNGSGIRIFNNFIFLNGVLQFGADQHILINCYISSLATLNLNNRVTASSSNNNDNQAVIPGTGNINQPPQFNNVSLGDISVLPQSEHFKNGSGKTHIGNAIYGIPLYNATSFSIKDPSLHTITGNGFKMTSWKDLNAASGTINLDFRIVAICLIGGEDINHTVDSRDVNGLATLNMSFNAPTDETGGTNNGIGDHVIAEPAGYFKFRKADGTTTSNLLLPLCVQPIYIPIGYDDAGRTYFDADFKGTVVIVGNELYSDFVTWTATTFNSGAYVEYQGKPYKANANTLSTDVPGVSTKWDTWNAYIEAAEVQVELKYPNGGGLDFKGITFCLKRNEEENITKYFI